MKSFTEWCQHYEYDPISPKVRADYQRYREQLELFQALPEEQSECSACGLLTATSSVVGENRSTVMRERYEQDDEGGGGVSWGLPLAMWSQKRSFCTGAAAAATSE